ncbi:MAG: M15 family metallopeptidase [Acidimicrobiia bacterium]
MTAAAVAVTLLVPTPGATSPVPSFNESYGCDALDGYHGPLAAQPGVIPLSEPIYGPWGDYFGRSMLDIASRVQVMSVPGFSTTFHIHERVVPAFQQVVATLEEHRANGREYNQESYSGAWARLTIPPGRRMSFHSIAAAIDLNSVQNPYSAANILITNMNNDTNYPENPDWFVDAWRDNGFCWGGDWGSIKDPMHFSWKGPLHTPGYPTFAPYPPKVPATNFTVSYDLRVGLTQPPPAGSTHHVADLDRNGAVDVVRVQPWGETGNMVLVAALARNGHGVGNIRATTSGGLVAPEGTRLLTDITNDGRPDLVYLYPTADWTLGRHYFPMIFPLEGGYKLNPVTDSLPIPYDGSQTVLFDDHNLDGTMDAFVISPGDPVASLTVWLGPNFTTPVGPIALTVPFEGHRFAIGDRNTDGTIDGRSDLFALSTDGQLVVHQGTTDPNTTYTSTATIQTPATMGASDAFFVADLDGDGHDDLFVVKPSGATTMYRGGASTHYPGIWYEWTAAHTANWSCPTSYIVGALTDTPQVALVNPQSGLWCLRGKYGQLQSFYFGNPGDYPMMGDWDCDGVDTPGLYRQSDGYVYLRNTNTQGNADIKFFFGNPGDIPLAGDFSGNGCDTVSIYRPSNQTFYIINELGQNDGGLGAAEFSYVFGNPGDKPFTGDFNGNGQDTVGLHRESTGFVYFRNTHTQGNADNQFFFGNPGDRFVAGDWNGDGKDTPGVYRPSARTLYLRYTNSQGNANEAIRWGDSSWLPVSGRFRLP